MHGHVRDAIGQIHLPFDDQASSAGHSASLVVHVPLDGEDLSIRNDEFSSGFQGEFSKRVAAGRNRDDGVRRKDSMARAIFRDGVRIDGLHRGAAGVSGLAARLARPNHIAELPILPAVHDVPVILAGSIIAEGHMTIRGSGHIIARIRITATPLEAGDDDVIEGVRCGRVGSSRVGFDLHLHLEAAGGHRQLLDKRAGAHRLAHHLIEDRRLGDPIVEPHHLGIVRCSLRVVLPEQGTRDIQAVKGGHIDGPTRPAHEIPVRVEGPHDGVPGLLLGREIGRHRGESIAGSHLGITEGQGPLGLQGGIVGVGACIADVRAALVAIVQAPLGGSVIGEILEVNGLQTVARAAAGSVARVDVAVIEIGGHAIITGVSDEGALGRVMGDGDAVVVAGALVGASDVLAVAIGILSRLAEPPEHGHLLKGELSLPHGVGANQDHQTFLSQRGNSGVHSGEFTFELHRLALDAILDEIDGEFALGVGLGEVGRLAQDEPHLGRGDPGQIEISRHQGDARGVRTAAPGVTEAHVLLARRSANLHAIALGLSHQGPTDAACLSEPLDMGLSCLIRGGGPDDRPNGVRGKVLIHEQDGLVHIITGPIPIQIKADVDIVVDAIGVDVREIRRSRHGHILNEDVIAPVRALAALDIQENLQAHAGRARLGDVEQLEIIGRLGRHKALDTVLDDIQLEIVRPIEIARFRQVHGQAQGRITRHTNRLGHPRARLIGPEKTQLAIGIAHANRLSRHRPTGAHRRRGNVNVPVRHASDVVGEVFSVQGHLGRGRKGSQEQERQREIDGFHTARRVVSSTNISIHR